VSKKKTMRVALASMKHIPGQVDFNLEQHRKWLDRCLEREPDFVGFPEFSLTGWVYDPKQMLTLDSAPVKEVERWARRSRVFLATSFVEKRGGRFYNATVIAGPRGRVGVMRKVNLVSSEAKHYAPGREFPVFDVGGCRMGVTTCADASYIEMMRILSFRGAEVIFAPHANTLGKYGNCRDGWIRWRMENWPFFARACCVCIAGVSCCGLLEKSVAGEEELKYCGGAMAMDWTGKPLAKAGGRAKTETMIWADLDLAGLRKAREGFGAEFRPAIVYNRRDGWVLGRAS